MIFSRLIALVMMVLLVGIPAAAQDGYPLPENLPSITLDNAAQVTELARVGGVLPGDLVWSPDGGILAAGTSAGVKLYDADNLTAAPRLISGGKDVLFNPAGTVLVSGGQIWNARTGNAIASIGAADTREFSPSGNILVTSRGEEGETRVFLWDTRGKPLATLDTDSPLVFRGAVFNADETQLVLKLMGANTYYEYTASILQIWDVVTGKMIKTVQGDYQVWGAVAFAGYETQLFAETITDGYGENFRKVMFWHINRDLPPYVIDRSIASTLLSPGRKYALFHDVQSLTLINLNSFEQITLQPEELTFGYNIQPIFSPNQRWLAAATDEFLGDISAYQVALWDVRGQDISIEPDYILGHDSPIQDYIFSDDSRFLAVQSAKQVFIWDMWTQTQKW